ncbi:MAG: DUF6701 domain-containing protein [Methylophilus sp.]|uniref:DUF6701 domain-containing protein n=1 Tax=Methylophilus sp. TaxID=29541 RepID=UPI003FA17380
MYICLGLVSNPLFAVTLNSSGGTNASNGLKVFIDTTGQMQVIKSGNGQLYRQSDEPYHRRLYNGVFVRSNGVMYGPSNDVSNSTGSALTALQNATVVMGPTPATVSQGVTQTTTTSFRAGPANRTTGPDVRINWKYTYPLDYVTAEVTITITDLTVSSSNPVRYYHMVDTFLGGNDCGCGVTFPADKNRPQTVGTYPWAGRCASGDTTSSVSCPSTTALPQNLDVVESFRERNGKFSAYCVGSWSSFWTNNEACSMFKTQPLSSTVNNRLIDTGVAIEYDFTSVGVYTFSYDFVVGSTYVPAYDHIEIRHPGTASLCPVNVQVMACLTSAVPCPDNQLISSGALLGDLVVSGTPTVTKTPNEQFNIGSAGAIEDFALQANAAGVSVLGASGMTTQPLSGVKCWNTTTNSQSCSLTFTNTPCVSTYECMENSLDFNNLPTTSTKRNPLYTKVFGKDIEMDVVAVLASGAQSSGYNATPGLTVDLVVEEAGGCGSTVVASQTVPFTTSDNGRRKVTFTASAPNMLLGTYPKNANPVLRCKVRDLLLNKSGCSSDNFALRPQAFTVSSTNAVETASAATPSSTVNPVFKAATDNFNLTASTGESGYTGTPQIKAKETGTGGYNPLIAHTGQPSVGSLIGGFTAAASGKSSTNFKYSEVGHFKFKPQAVFDDTYAAVDTAMDDCEKAAPNQFNNDSAATPKKYGCAFGNTIESSYFGRFIPDRFKIEPGAIELACGTFVYYGQDTPATTTPSSPGVPGIKTPFTLSAINGNGQVTQYYTGAYTKFALTSWDNFSFTASPLNGATFAASDSTPVVSGSWLDGTANVVARHKLTRPANQVNSQPVTIKAQVQQNEGTSLLLTPVVVTTIPTQVDIGIVSPRYGRLVIIPAHGSELLPLPVQMEAQYLSGGNYIRSLGDGCTSIAPSSVVMKNYRGNLNACETQLTGGPLMGNGVLNMVLSAPKIGSNGRPNSGSVDLEVNLRAKAVPPADIERTCISAAESDATSGVIPWLGGPDPVGRASFGIYKAPIIYMRENF